MGQNNGRRKVKKPTSSYNNGDYDLKHSLRKLNQRKNLEGGTTQSEYDSQDLSKSRINSNALNLNPNDSTGFVMHINDSMNARYDKLKDDISNVSDKIGTSSDNLRAEFERKLEIKLNSTLFNKLFYGAISALIAIASIFYIFSYSRIVSDVDSNKTKIDSLSHEVKHTKKAINVLNTTNKYI